jgi:hypothetical protein
LAEVVIGGEGGKYGSDLLDERFWCQILQVNQLDRGDTFAELHTVMPFLVTIGCLFAQAVVSAWNERHRVKRLL